MDLRIIEKCFKPEALPSIPPTDYFTYSPVVTQETWDTMQDYLQCPAEFEPETLDDLCLRLIQALAIAEGSRKALHKRLRTFRTMNAVWRRAREKVRTLQK